MNQILKVLKSNKLFLCYLYIHELVRTEFLAAYFLSSMALSLPVAGNVAPGSG